MQQRKLDFVFLDETFLQFSAKKHTVKISLHEFEFIWMKLIWWKYSSIHFHLHLD